MHPPNFFDSLFDVAHDVVDVATPIAALFGVGESTASAAPAAVHVAQVQPAAAMSNDTVLIVAAVALLLLFK